MNVAAMQEVTLALADRAPVEEILPRIVRGVAVCQNVVLCRIWLVQSRTDSHGEHRWLELAVSAGNPVSKPPRKAAGASRFQRFEIGERKIGRVAESGEGLHLERLAGTDEWIADPAWARAESVAAFAAQPLVCHGEVLGVLAMFDRKPISSDDFRWLRTFADHAAVSISNARAWEEIQRLKDRLAAENDYLREEVTEALDAGEILGRSPALRKVLQQIELVAATDAAVLISGESGTGKELVARAIHERSRRKERPLIKVNCGAIPAELFESEFFGHARGSFTGAVGDRIGRFELADGGTLFLDELGEIPPAHQAKLLRVLQEGTFERVGEGKTRKVDVRVVAATNRDLRTEVKAGRFREDLYYRLGVFPIEVPPLRDRMDDLASLASAFVAQAAKRSGLAAPRISRADLERLGAWNWPGNVRELRNVLERAVILGRGRKLVLEGLGIADAPEVRSRPKLAREAETPLPTLREWRSKEREIIEDALRRADGKISGPGGAAELLGLRPTTLDSKLRALRLRPAPRSRQARS
ncbi:MAG: sigma 54-interacting transcriptional regulator [Planctomycetota bacterium]|nr:sigma 54-interacting transcriptional regulator [Planctomycetota bacterium]